MQNRAGLSPEKLGVDFVNRGVIFPVGNKDAVEGHIRHRATRCLDHLADSFQNVAGLRLWVIGKQHVIVLIKSQRTGDIHHAISQRAGNEGASGALLPAE